MNTKKISGMVGIAVLALFIAQGQARAQETYWEGTVDNNWSTAGNWTDGVGGSSTDYDDVWFSDVDPEGIVNVDTTPTTVGRLVFSTGATNFTISGNTITNSSAPFAVAVVNNSTNSVQTINCNIVENHARAATHVQSPAPGSSLVFNGSYTVLGSTISQISAGTVIFNHSLSCNSDVRIDADNTHAIFNNSVSNAMNGLLLFIAGSGSSELTVNTPAGINFYNGARIQHNANGATATFNTANVLGDSTAININNKTATYNFNADENLGTLTLGQGTMNLVLGDSVEQLYFNKSSVQNWTGGSLVISNFMPSVIRFGSDATGLTAAQLAAISAYDAAGLPVTDLDQDSSGFLVGTITRPPVKIGDISLAILSGGTNLTLSWDTTNGAPYVVETTTDLVAIPWTDAITNIVGNGGSITVTTAVSEAQSFYKVSSSGEY